MFRGKFERQFKRRNESNVNGFREHRAESKKRCKTAAKRLLR